MNSHEIDYKIIGNDIQLVEIELDPNETVIAEAGAMVYMEDDINFETKLGDGSTPNQGFITTKDPLIITLPMRESIFLTQVIGNFLED